MLFGVLFWDAGEIDGRVLAYMQVTVRAHVCKIDGAGDGAGECLRD